MKIIVDGDGCPVVKHTIEICKKENIELIIVKNINHKITSDYGQIITVDFSRDSADYKIANLTKDNDIVVTQDYGLCAMVISKGGLCINQNGKIIDSSNIDTLLASRHFNQEQRRKHKKHNSKFKKRDNNMNEIFKIALIDMIKSISMLQ